MNAASVVRTSSSSHRNVRTMLAMMPSDPLPAITFSTLVSYWRRELRADKGRRGIAIEIPVARRMASMPSGDGPSGFSFEAS